MSEPAFRQLVEQHWAALEARPTTGENRLRVSQLPVMTDEGALAAAVDHEGHRHLLVPMSARLGLRSGLDGPVLRLRKRPLEDEDTYQTYADLACLREDLNDLFTKLCVDVLTTVQGLSGNPIKVLYRVLDRWKALFLTHGPGLDPEQLAGLFGELIVLEKLLRHDPGAHRLWLGPKGHRHDFSTGVDAIEVKSAVDPSGRKPRIHGLGQLEPPAGGSLCLVWFGLHRVTASGGGTGFVDLVERVRRRCDDESAVLGLLAEAGYRHFEVDRYRDVRFGIGEEIWFPVGPGFPGLTNSALDAVGLPVSVLDVEYTIDLSGRGLAFLTSDEVSHMTEHIVQESE
ncbi:PD-(D/E)XK motif protein [Streptomyces sp. SM1]|uniref:PD-(D/E)XK motif protein n=1 Tax=Streptomyces sp. SM1 TaxID=402229 RepID=UPI000CD4C11E|nr:PD-(D/E)XK motif protein [Streptomyces sp. SM1]